MSSHRHRRVTRASARRLLDGGAGSPTTATDPLTRLIAAAAAPGPAGELPGEAAAMAAFRAARLAAPRPVPARRSTVTRILSVKVAVIAAVVAASGIAVAAGTGIVPNPLAPHTRTSAHPTATPRTGHPNPTRTSPSPGPGTSAAPSSGPSTPSVSPTPSGSSATSGTPSASLTRQCRNWTRLAAKDRGKALDTPAYADLIAAAGGRDNVESYCAALLTPTPTHDAKPHPSGQPDGSPNPHSSG